VPIFSQLMYGLVNLAARNGLAQPSLAKDFPAKDEAAKQAARKTGIRGETYAYWYLRHLGYILIARNYTAPSCKGEIDLVGYDGPVLAFIEVKTRVGEEGRPNSPEEAVNSEKRRNLSRMARRFLAERRIPEAQCRFDVLAIESRPGQKPVVRLHKGAFAAEG
jgi:putative endonuclease